MSRRRKINIPVAVGNTIAPEMSPRVRTQMMDNAFIQTGGLERLVDWANKNDDNYATFIKLWARGQLRVVDPEQKADNRMEDVLARLDAGEHARVILGTAEQNE